MIGGGGMASATGVASGGGSSERNGRDQDEQLESPLDFKILRRIFSYMGPYAAKRNLVFLMTACRAFLRPANALLLGWIISDFITHGDYRMTVWGTLGYAVLALLTEYTQHLRQRRALGVSELAASAFVNALTCVPIALATGLGVAVSVQVSHEHGGDAAHEESEAFRNGFVLSIVIGALLTLLMLLTIPFLELFQQAEEVVSLAPSYLIWIALSMVPAVSAGIMRGFAEAKGKPWNVQWISSSTIVLNILLNYALIFGNFGAPAMGLFGAGLATFLSRSIAFVATWAYLCTSSDLKVSIPRKWVSKLNLKEVLEQLKIAAPVAGQLLILLGAFSLSGILIGSFGSESLAAHQIVLTCVGSSFMIPLGLSLALTIRVGHCVSADEPHRCKDAVFGAQVMTFLFTLLCGIIYVAFRYTISGFFSEENIVNQIVAGMLLLR